MSGCVAVINAGSSSIKFALYDADKELELLFRGQIESIGRNASLKVVNERRDTVMERSWSDGALDHRGGRGRNPSHRAEAGERQGDPGGRPPGRAWRRGICRADAHRPACDASPREAGAAGAAAPAAQSRGDPDHLARRCRACRRSPASTRPSTAASRRLPSRSRCRDNCPMQVCGATAFMGCPMSTLRPGFACSIRRWRRAG